MKPGTAHARHRRIAGRPSGRPLSVIHFPRSGQPLPDLLWMPSPSPLPHPYALDADDLRYYVFWNEWAPGCQFSPNSMLQSQEAVSMPPRRPAPAAQMRGQGILEYALIMLFVVLVVFGGLILLGPQISHVFGSINNAL